MEIKNDVEVLRVALMALVRRLSDDQINRVIGELEHVATQEGDRTGESVQAQAALQLIAALEARRKCRNWSSLPPPTAA